MRARALVMLLVVLALCALGLGAGSSKSVVPPYEVVKTRNGVEVYYFPSPNVPLFEVHLVFAGGSDLDPPGLSGLGMFSASMIKRGVPGLDENAISRKLDDLAGSIDVSVAEEQVTVAAYGLTEHAEEISSLMFTAVKQPTFPEAPFRRIRLNHLDSILQLPDSPSGLATHVIDTLIFNGTPKARPGSGLKSDVARLKLSDVREYYPSLVRADRMKALVVGGKHKKEVLEHVVRGIEQLPCAACGKPVVRPRALSLPKWRAQPGKALLVSRPGISEAQVRFGFLGPKRDTPEYYDLRVAEVILGGHFASRLNLVIREKMNLTYGIGAGFSFGPSLGTFVVTTSTRNEKIAVLLNEVNRQLADFVRGPISEQEIQMAKDYLTGSFPLGLQNIYAIAGAFFSGRWTGLSADFMDQFQPRIAAVSAESLKAAVQKHFKLGQMKTVIVGDVKALAPVLDRAKISYSVREPADFL